MKQERLVLGALLSVLIVLLENGICFLFVCLVVCLFVCLSVFVSVIEILCFCKSRVFCVGM